MENDPFFDPQFPEIVKQKLRAQMPYDFRAAAPRSKVRWGQSNHNADDALGYIHKDEPETIRFNRFGNSPNNELTQLMPHEFEHVLQNRASKRYPKGYDMEVVSLYPKGSKQLVSNLQKAAVDEELWNHLTKLGATPSPYLGKSPKGWFSLQEQFADLSSIEQVLKKDLTKDPVIRKRFFQDDQEMIDAYKASTGLRTERLDAKDLPPMTIPKARHLEPPKPLGFLEQLLSKFK